MAAPVRAFFGSECVWCFLIIFSLIGCTSTANRTLKLTHVLYRHGNRSPIMTYPSDPYQEDSWPQGFGQLTQKGMHQHFELGQWFRKRYMTDFKFLNTTYKRSEIHIRSTSYDRTLMSAESNLAGLYPPEGRQVWNKQLAWQPIPIFTKPKADDTMFLVEDAEDCPRFKEFREDLEVEHKTYLDKNKDFLQPIAKHAGFNVNNVTYHNYTRIADAFTFEMADGRSLPKWATADLVKRFVTIMNYSYMSEARLPDEYVRLGNGVLMKEIVGHLRNKTAGTDDTKMYMYSAHDDNVAGLLRALNVFNDVVPTPASCVLIELYQEGDKSFTVDVLYKNSSRKEPYKLQLLGTGERCTLDQFYKNTENMLLTDVKAACNAQKKKDGSGSLLPKTWNTGNLPFTASRRTVEWLLFVIMLLVIALLTWARKGGKFLRNLHNSFKLRVFKPSPVPDV